MWLEVVKTELGFEGGVDLGFETLENGGKQNTKKWEWDFPVSPVVKSPTCNAGNSGSIPGQGIKILHATGQWRSLAQQLWPSAAKQTNTNKQDWKHSETVEVRREVGQAEKETGGKPSGFWFFSNLQRGTTEEDLGKQFCIQVMPGKARFVWVWPIGKVQYLFRWVALTWSQFNIYVWLRQAAHNEVIL